MLMSDQKRCDFCGRSEDELPEAEDDANKLTLDSDSLWVCLKCKDKLVTRPGEQQTPNDIDDALLPLIGQNAGAICRTLALPYEPPYKHVLNAASTIAYDEDYYMSTWTFVSQWLDGTTVWRCPDGTSQAFVSADGSLRITSR
jgi:hypothetical protein